MNISFDAVYYEPSVLSYPLGQQLKEKYADLPWQEIESHNHIQQFRNAQNSEFPKLKRNLIIGTRKTHKYTENHKVSDFLVPYTSSGCSAMCLYCYLVCNYNKCSYLRLFVNREQMLDKLIKTAEGLQSVRKTVIHQKLQITASVRQDWKQADGIQLRLDAVCFCINKS